MRKNILKRMALVLLAVTTVVAFSATVPAEGENLQLIPEVTAKATGGTDSVPYNKSEAIALTSNGAEEVNPTAFANNWGDVDHNGQRDSTDARLVLQFAVGKIQASVLDTDAANVDGSSKIDSTDARLILQYAVQKIQSFPVSKTVYAYAVEQGLTNAASEAEWLKTLQGDEYAEDANIVGAYVDAEKHLILKMSNGTVLDAGCVSDQTEEEVPPSATVYHTVTFKDHDGTELKTEQVESGKNATTPDSPSRDGYLFVGWDTAFVNVTADMTVIAEYKEISEPTLAAASVFASAGETVEVPVTVYKNPGIAGARIFVTYDDKLSLANAATGAAFSNLDYTAPASFDSPCPFNWDSLDAVSTANGAVMLLTFEVPADAVAGETFNIGLSYRSGDIYDGALNDVELELIGGSVTVR